MSSATPTLITAAALLVFASPAYGLGPTTEAHLDEVVEHVYRGSPHTGVSCGPVCTTLWTDEQAASNRAALQKELRTLRIRAGVNPRLGDLYRLDFGPTELSWKIHRGARSPAKLLRVGIPGSSSSTGGATQRRLEYWGYGEGQTTSGNVALPNNVWAFTYRYAFQTWTHVVSDFRAPGCMYTSPPPGLLARYGRRNHCVGGAETVSYFLPENDLGAPAAIQDYTGQAVDREGWAPADPGRQVVTERVRAELQGPSYPELNAWYDAQGSILVR